MGVEEGGIGVGGMKGGERGDFAKWMGELGKREKVDAGVVRELGDVVGGEKEGGR